jgi:hypothetical protein
LTILYRTPIKSSDLKYELRSTPGRGGIPGYQGPGGPGGEGGLRGGVGPRNSAGQTGSPGDFNNNKGADGQPDNTASMYEMK